MTRILSHLDPVSGKHEFLPVLRPPLSIETHSDVVIGHDERFELQEVDTNSSVVNKGACVLIGGHTNFGHHVFQHLTKLAVVERFKDETMCLPIAVWDEVPARFWNQLGLAREVKVVKPGKFECALLPSCPVGRSDQGVYCWPDAIHWLRQRFPRSHGNRRIYAVRNSDKRKIINREEVETLLHKLDFEFIQFAEHSFLEQIKIASEASIIVMPNGADAPITLWADSDCALIELNNSQLIGTFGIQLWAMVTGNPYHRMTPVGHGEFRGIDTDFVCDVRGLEEAIRKMG